jgi:hypothetical protein
MRSESKARFRRLRRVSPFSAPSNFLPSSAVNQFPDTHSQSADALHAPNACREVRAKKSAIRRFISEPAYRRQSQVYCRRGVRVLFQRDSIACDHSSVEG